MVLFWDQLIIRGFSILTTLSQIFIAIYILDLILGRFSKIRIMGRFWDFLGKKALYFTLLVSFVAMAGSLTFSEVLNFTPCILCWYQRIIMYPMVLFSLLAILWKDKHMAYYLFIFGLLGALIAGYHYLGQIDENTTLPCPAVGYSAACSDAFFMEFGYITIPMMALTAFVLIAILSLNAKLVEIRGKKKKSKK